jgi:signal transduction histidine kinase
MMAGRGLALPIRLRLTLAFAAGTAVVLAALGAFLYLRLGHDLTAAIDMDLRSRAQALAGEVGARRSGAVDSRGSLIDPDEAFAQVLTPDGRIVDSSSGVARAPMLDRAAAAAVRGPEFLTTRVRGVDDPARLLAVPSRAGGRSLVVVVGATLGDRNEALGRLLLELAIGGPVALAVVSWGGWALAGASLRPVERMRREAAAISLAEPGRRLAVPPTGDELAGLATTLNAMLDRLQESVQREQRFMDAAGHELRTPLGVLRMELDLALSRARTREELAAALRNASEETDRLVRLAEDLLVASRVSGGRLPLHRTETAVDDLLRRTAASTGARAAAADIAIEVECDDRLSATMDPERIRQALDDLLDNAIRHTPPEGTVTLAAARHDGRLHLSVRDTGPGFAQEALRDASPDASRNPPDDDGGEVLRQSDTGTGDGHGLGLSIVRTIARAHGGTLRLDNPDGGGARATLDLPAADPS